MARKPEFWLGPHDGSKDETVRQDEGAGGAAAGGGEGGEDSNDADESFADSMIPNHEDAVDIAEDHQEHGSNPVLLGVSRAIVGSHKAHIVTLKSEQGKMSKKKKKKA